MYGKGTNVDNKTYMSCFIYHKHAYHIIINDKFVHVLMTLGMECMGLQNGTLVWIDFMPSNPHIEFNKHV